MADLKIAARLVERLKTIAARENRAVDDVLDDMLNTYVPHQSVTPSGPLDAMQGAFDDDVTNLSTTVRETMTDFYRRKHARPD